MTYILNAQKAIQFMNLTWDTNCHVLAVKISENVEDLINFRLLNMNKISKKSFLLFNLCPATLATIFSVLESSQECA